MRAVLRSMSLCVVFAACGTPPIDDYLATPVEDPPPSSDAGRSDGSSTNRSNPTGGDGGSTTQTFAVNVKLLGSGTASITSTPSGVTCSGTTCTGSFAKGTKVTLAAAPAPGSFFVAWTGDCSGAGACAPIVDHDIAIFAELTTLDGTWTGTYTNTRQAFGCTFNNAGNLTILGSGTGTSISHSGDITGLELRQISGCGLVGKTTGTAPSSPVTVAGDTITGTWTFNVQGASGTLAFPFTAKVTGKSITGSWTCQTCTGSFTLTKP
jgi:hypothetical protein